jgi:hypothetical protein
MSQARIVAISSPTPDDLTPHEERVVAVMAGCDPRTVRARRAGRPVTSTNAARIDKALDAFFAKRR